MKAGLMEEGQGGKTCGDRAAAGRENSLAEGPCAHSLLPRPPHLAEVPHLT